MDEGVRRVGMVANGLGWGLALWVFLWPHPYWLAVLIGVLSPFGAWGLCLWSGRQIAVTEQKGDGRVDVTGLTWFAALAVAVRGLSDVQIFDWQWLLAGAVFIGAGWMAMTWWVDPASLRLKFMWVFLGLISIAYGWGVLALADQQLDSAPASVYRSAIEGMRISHGKSTSYYLTLAPWGPQTQADEVDVGRRFYRTVSRGEIVCVLLHPGFLKARWFEIRKCGVNPSP